MIDIVYLDTNIMSHKLSNNKFICRTLRRTVNEELKVNQMALNVNDLVDNNCIMLLFFKKKYYFSAFLKLKIFPKYMSI